MNEITRREDLPWMDFYQEATGEKLPPVTPGEVLREEFMMHSDCRVTLWKPSSAFRRTV